MKWTRNRARGFSLIEAMVAGAVFILGVTSATALVMMSSRQRGSASKGASMSRLITEEYLNLARRGYDGLVHVAPAPSTIDSSKIPGWSPTKPDADGRVVALSGLVTKTCGSLAPFSASPTPTTEDDTHPCCVTAGRMCCLGVSLTATWTDFSKPGTPPISESYQGFITKSCP